jgi:hypothetical protein
MQSRLLRVAAVAGLSAVFGLACKEDPQTHTTFTAVTSNTPKPDGGMPQGSAGSSGAAGSTTGTAGAAGSTTGTAGAAGSTTGTAGAAGSTMGTAGGTGTTSGCGMDPNQPTATYFEYHLTAAGHDRIYYVRLPNTYDQTKPIRVVYLGPGCGGNTPSQVFKLYPYSGENAILVAMMPLPDLPYNGCFDETMTSIEYPFFDLLHKQIESKFCVDTSRQFYAGFSTGARLGFMLDCAFADVLRGTATDQGALPPLPACKSHPIAGFFLADTQETGNPYQSNVMAANRLAMQNGCTGNFQNATTFDPMTTTPLPPTTACVKYTGCPADYPIVFCTTMGQGHQTFEPWSDEAYWNFFKQF